MPALAAADRDRRERPQAAEASHLDADRLGEHGSGSLHLAIVIRHLDDRDEAGRRTQLRISDSFGADLNRRQRRLLFGRRGARGDQDRERWGDHRAPDVPRPRFKKTR